MILHKYFLVLNIAFDTPKKGRCFQTKHSLGNMNQPRMIRGRLSKSPAFPGGTEPVVRKIFSYQVPDMVGTNASTNENHNFYNSTPNAISRGRGNYVTSFGSLCACFVDMGEPAKTQVESGLSKLFDLRGQTIDVSVQYIFS